jgi:SAM-dependent methyltransferase
MPLKIPPSETRTLEQLKEHYDIEKELANTLRKSSKDDRQHLYTSLYDELFRRVPHHPLIGQLTSPDIQQRRVSEQIKLIAYTFQALCGRSLDKRISVLEIGPGDCSLSLEVAKSVNTVYAIDVSEKVVSKFQTPTNFHLIISDGSSINVPGNSIDIAYSNQLMEHLHPDDAVVQLQNIYYALAPGGIYICLTPNRLSGPADISKYFDEEATGFHLKEYTNSELSDLFRKVGFSKVRQVIRLKGRHFIMPLLPIRWTEGILAALPQSIGKTLARRSPIQNLLAVRLAAIK